MYSLRGGHQHHSSKKMLLAEWLASFVVAMLLVGVAWYAWSQVLQQRGAAQYKAAASQTTITNTCIAAGSQTNDSTPEVCPDK